MASRESEFNIHRLPAEIGHDYSGRVENYTVNKILGMGKSAVVFKATTEGGSAVALKISKSSDEEFLARSIKSAEIQGKVALATPNVPEIYEAKIITLRGSEHSLVVMGYAGEKTFGDELARGTLDVSDVVRRLELPGDALDAMNGLGYVHRDIKPGNIVGGKLIDFDTACEAETEVDPDGTVGYLAPEQVTPGAKPSVAIDIFGAGATVVHALTGSHAAEDEKSYMDAIMDGKLGDYVRARIERAGQTPNVEKVLLRAHAADPRDRFPSVREFLRDLASADSIKKERTAFIDLGSTGSAVYMPS